MNVDAIQSAASVLAAPDFDATAVVSTTPALSQSSDGSGFGGMVVDGLNQINQQLLVQQTDMQQLATGQVENLHQVMIRMEEARLSFDLMMQVRNRVLESYQDVMKMQV